MARRWSWRPTVLRSVLIAIGLVALASGVIAIVMGMQPAWVVVCWAAILVASLVFERSRYKRIEKVSPGAGWTKTQERFIDEESGETVTVWLDPASGERKYVKS